MSRLSPAVLALAVGLAGSPATAQVTYGGYDLGPDYGAMFEREMEKFNQFGAQLAEYERQVTEQAMADPLCQKLFQGHQQQSGGMDFPNFAFLCWATRYFTPDGIADFQRSEQENWRKEHLAAIDLRQMEAIRGQAQNDLNAGIGKGQLDLGTATADRDFYFDPWSSQVVQLPQFTRPNEPFWDAQTQRYYTMDAGGTYLVWNNGAWQPIQIQPRQ